MYSPAAWGLKTTYVVISFAAILRGPDADGAGARRAATRQYKYDKRSVEASIQFGRRVATFMQSLYGQEPAESILKEIAKRAKGSQPRSADDPEIDDLDASDPSHVAADWRRCIPYGFWQRFMREELAIAPNARKRMQLMRSLQFYALRKQQGAITFAAMRDMRVAHSCRSAGGVVL